MPQIPAHHFHWHRFTARAGSGHAAENVFRQQRRPLDPDSTVAADDNLRTRERAVWFAGAFSFVICGAVPFLINWLPSFPGFEIPADMVGPWQLGAGLAAFVVATVYVACGLRNIPTLPWLPYCFGSAIVLLSVAILTIPQYAPLLMGIYIVPAVASAFYLKPQLALPLLLATGGALAYIGYYNRNEPYGVIEASMMMIFLLGSTAIMALARDRIQQGISLNIEIAGRDPLTGAANLRQLRERLSDEIRRAKRRDLPVTIILLDLDDFGAVNARFSHTLGDAVLVASSIAMQKLIRKDELLARRGDDEFAVVAVGESGDELVALVDRLKRAVMIERQRLCPDVTVAVSTGYATWRQGESAAAMMRRADSALHIGRMSGPADV